MPHFLRTPWRDLLRRPLAGGLALLGWLLLPQLGHAQTVTIPAANTNTITNRYPLTTYYGYTRTAAIYTATEIGTSTGGTITSVGYYLQTASSPDAVPVKVYVKTVGTATGFTANTTVAAEESGATLVYNATVPASQFVAGTWVTLPFSTNFVYNGTDNLEVIVETNYGGSGGPEGSTGKSFRFSNGATRSFQYWEADISPPTSTGTRQASRANIQLSFLQAGCTGTPAAGTAAASPTSICPSGSTTISLSGGTSAGSISYQLQSSVGSTGPWSNTGTASTTSSTFTTTVTSSSYFRIATTCANSGQTAYSTPVQVTVVTPTYAALPYTQTFENTWSSVCGTRDVPDGSWKSTPLSGDNAWRRYDDGTAGGWSSTNGAYTPTGSNAGGASSANSARFHSYNAASGAQGTLDLYVNASGTGTPTLTFDYINLTASDKIEVLLSTDGGTTFGSVLFSQVAAASWTTYTVPLTGATATSVVRFRATSDDGADDIGLDNVKVNLVSCGAVTTLTAGSITTTTAQLTFTAPSGASSYAVTYTPSGGTATTVSPAPTASPVPLSGLAPGTTYAVSVVTNCGGGSTSTATTTSFTTAYSCVTPTYASLPYSQTFEGTYLSNCALRDVPDGNWKISPVTGESAWRRYDDGVAANWTNISGGAYTPAGSNAGGASSTYSARYHSYFASSGNQGLFDLYVNASGTGTPTLTFDYLNTSGTDKLEVLLSTDGGATFGSALFSQVLAANWTTYTVPLTGATATSVVRFRATSDYGATDIGLDNVGISLVGCSPITALTAGSITSTSAQLTFTAPSGASSYAVTYTPVGGAATTVSPAPTASPVPLSGLAPGTTYAVSVVTNCGGGSTSTAATTSFTTAYACVTPTYASLPYSQTFESTWVSNCALRDVPSLNWKLTPGATDPDASFRRYDDGAAAGWTNGSTNYGYTPAGSNAGGASSTYSARYHSGNVYPVTEFALFDLYVNASGGTGTPTLTFDYINTDGSDQLQVFLSTDGGATFGAALFTQVVSSVWTTYTVPLTGATATSVVRFKAMGDNGSTDIGLDNVNVSLVSCGTVTALTAGSITTTTAQLTFTAPSGASSYAVTYTPSGGTATTVSPAPTASPVPLSGLAPGTTYAVSVVTNCGGSTSTAATTSFTTAYSCVTPTYASLPYSQTFESTWVSNCALRDVPSLNWKGNPTSGDNAWRRYDDGTAGGWSGTSGAYSPAGSNAGGATSSYSARFHSYNAANGLQGTLDLYVNASGAGTSALMFDYLNTSGSDKLEVLFSTDGGTTFGTAVFSQVLATSWTSYTVPLTNATATTVVRFRATSDDGFTDIGLDNVSVTGLPDLIVDGTNSSTGSPYSASGTYNNVSVNNGGTANLSGSLTVQGTLTINSGGTLNTAGSQVLGTGNFVLNAGGTLGIYGAAGISVGPATTGVIRNTGATRSFSTDASYVYNGVAAQNTGAGLPSTVRNLTTTNNSDVTLTNPVSVTQVVTVGGAGNLALNGQALTLLSSASGTALIVNSGTGLVTGATGVAQRYLATSNLGNGYRQYSAPVSGSTVADLATSGFSPTVNPAYNTSATPATVRPFPTVYGYDQSRLASTTNNLTPFNKGWYSPAATSDPLAVGQGYTVQLAGNQLVDFVGTFTSGNQAVNLSRGASADAGLALVGNPYPAPMDWSLVQSGTDRSGLDGTIWVFASSGPYAGTYRTYTNGQGGNPIVPMGQGFFVRVTPGQSSGSLTFKNSHRLTSPDATAMQRTTLDLRPQVVLELRTSAGAADAFYAYAEAGATAGADAEFDGLKLPNTTGLNLSSTAASGEALAIDGRPAFAVGTELPLQVGVPAAGSYTLTATGLRNLPAGLTAYLRDAQTGQTLPLVVGQDYAFSVTASQAQAVVASRFTLVFRNSAALAATPSALAAAVSLYPNPAGKAGFTVGVPAVAGATQVQAELLNALGQVVSRQAAALPTAGTALSFPTAELAAGVYVLRLTAGAATVTKRVVID